MFNSLLAAYAFVFCVNIAIWGRDNLGGNPLHHEVLVAVTIPFKIPPGPHRCHTELDACPRCNLARHVDRRGLEPYVRFALLQWKEHNL